MTAVKTTLSVLAGLTALAAAGAVQAQTMDANASQFNAGYGRMPGQDNRPINTYTRDNNGNRLIVDGIIQTGDSNSTYSRQGGAGDNVSGAGVLGGATAIGNSLNVVVQGNRNTVIVNSRQVNNGDVIAGVTNVTPISGGYVSGPNEAGAGARASAGTGASASANTNTQTSVQSGAVTLNGFDAPAQSGVGSNVLNGEIRLDDSGL